MKHCWRILCNRNMILFVTANISETISDEVLHRHYGPDVIVAEIRHRRKEGDEGEEPSSIQWKMSDVTVSEKLEKFVEDVK